MTDVIEQIEDAETVTVYPAIEGGPVDPPDTASTTWATITSTEVNGRQPILPAWMLSKQQRAATLRAVGNNALYHVGYHAFWSWKYLGKVAWYAPQGAWKATAATFWWTAGGKDNYKLRQSLANKDDAHTWKELNKVRAKESKAHWWVVIPALLVAGITATIAYHTGVVPRLGWYAIGAALTLLAAYHGKPADKPILDRVTHGPRFTKLTAEMVRNAVVALGIGVREPGDIKFPEDIHRDGPGWMARFDLPGALVATKVLERRDGLAAAMRLPIDQVWPDTIGTAHPGQVALWVGYQPSSKMGQPKWALTRENARTSVFEPQPFSTDARQRPANITLFANNVLIGGQPGSGKTYSARDIAQIALLDPTCELKVAEFKGTGDFLDMAELCSTYVCGVDDESLDEGEAIIDWALAECRRRAERIKKAKQRGEAPFGKVTPELATKRGSGLHPVVIVIDEVHELFQSRKGAAEKAERAIKQGRALGVILVLATQIADRDSVPPNITRCVTIRWCHSVGGQVENDMILGTGAYKKGLTATVYRPGIDAGWGVVTGLEMPANVRAFFPSPKESEAIIARATYLRGGKVVGTPDEVKVKARDMLADARACIRPGESGMPWGVLADRLAELDPEFYAGITADMVRESLARYNIQTQDVKVEGRNLKGVRRTALDAAEHQQITAE